MPFFLTHIESLRHVAHQLKLRPYTTAYDLALLGCILPDLEVAGILPKVHGRCKAFYEYILEADSEYAPLATGMLCHELYDGIMEPGYVAKKERRAEQILSQYYPDLKVKLAAHIFVEHAIDISLLKEQPELLHDLKRSLKRIDDACVKRIVGHLCDFFHADKKALTKALLTIRAFDVTRLQHSEGMNKFWLNCMLLLSEQHVLNEHAPTLVEKVKSALRIGVRYSKHTFLHSKEHARIALRNMHDALQDHTIVRTRSKNELAKKLAVFMKRHKIRA
ncbi:MAG: hypothetical protein Q7K43_05745 [Candidatus Woesearchaeota archaeon]|nr:hypothetical protein [Candidatus Woesearchaeota archaeon]